MSTPDPQDGQSASQHSPFPLVRWKFERTADGAQLLLWMQSPCELRCAMTPVRIPMSEPDAWAFIRRSDRVMSWSAQAAEGTFSTGPTPDQAASQLAICRYLVASRDLDTHTRMAQATPWANWVEQQWSPDGITWLVDVFAVDDHQFLQMALAYGVTVNQAARGEAGG